MSLNDKLNLTVDWGNTQIKVGYFSGGQLQKVQYMAAPEELHGLILQHKPVAIAYSDVTGKGQALFKKISLPIKLIELSHQVQLPFTVHYATPATLGKDRLAAVLGGQALFRGESVLVIDLGTCITYDFLQGGTDYLGGMISPGLQMRLKAMHTFTAKLPLPKLEPSQEFAHLSQSTNEALLAGAVNGITHEIEGNIKHFEEKLGNFKALLCGGDAVFFETKLKPSIFVEQHLLLVGLNRLLEIEAD